MTTQLPIPYDELPLWMRQARQEFDWSILIALAMSIAIAWTFVLRDELPAGHQLEHYVFQASDIVTGFDEGRFYPRWSPYVINGYGAPIPNFYPMGAAYIVASIETLFTNNLIQAVRLAFILTYALAGLGIYLLVSRRTDAPIGLLTSVLYLYSPMIGSTIPYVMGDLALLMASALLPLSLWSAHRILSYRYPIDFVLYCFIFALLIWIHPQMAAISLIMCYAFAIFDKFERTIWRRIPRLTLAAIGGCILVAFFWMPALLEHRRTDWYPVEAINTHQLDPIQLLSQVQQIDSGLLMPQAQFKLGWVVIIMAIIGIITLFVTPKTPRRFYVIMGTLSSIGLAFALLIAPQEIWLLSPITLCLSIIGGSALYLRFRFSIDISRLVLVLVIAITLIFSIPVWLVPDSNITISQVNAITQLRFEQQGFGYSSLPDHAPLPSTINPQQPPNRFLLNSYEVNAPQRYDEEQSNTNTIVSLLETASHQQTYRIFNAEPREISFLLPYFAGWQAYLSDVPLRTYADPQTGMLTVDMPRADNEELVITLSSTRLRSVAWVISLSMLGICILVVIRNVGVASNDDDEQYDLVVTMHRSDVRLTLFMFIALGVIISIFTSDIPPIQLQNPPTFTLSQSLPLQSRTSVGLEATTFELNKRVFQQNEELAVTIYWKALTSIQSNFQSRIILRDTSNRLVWYTGDLRYPGTIVSRRWVRNLYVADKYHLQLPDNLIPGDYQILIELYPCDSRTCNLDTPVQFFDINGNLMGKQLEIPLSITIQ